MKKGKRIIALFLAVLMIATSDTGVYQAFGMDAANQASEAEEAAGGEGQSSGTVDQEDISGQEQGGAGDTTNQEGGQQEAEVQTPPSNQDNFGADSGTDAAIGKNIGDAAGALETDGISTFAADSTQKIDLNAKVNNDMPAASVASGETFRYILGYNLPALGSSATYNAVTIKIPLPDHVSVAKDSSQSWGLAVTGQKIARVRLSKVDGVNTLSITMDTGLNAGQGSDISIVLKTENFQMADGTQIILNPTMEGVAGGVTVTGSIEEASRPVVTVNAKDGWKVSKSISQDRDVRISNDAKSYEATYTIKVDSTKANFNSNGRMAVTDYLLTDILPTLASAGSYDGYPDGGQPYEVAAVTMGGQPLVKGTDYDVVEEGDTVKSLKIRTYEKATQADVADYPNITEGSMMPTTYTVTLKYHRNPYIVESNKVLNKWTLTNTAQLDYALLGTAQAPSTDTAQIQLGEKEKAADPQSIVINKYLQVGTELLPMDEETSSKFHTGAVAFKLYDEDGQPAVDIEGNALKDANGNELADSTIAIGKDGSATFQNLYRGTYYIEEIVSDDSGLRVPSGKKIKVTVKNGQLALDDADGYTAELDGNGLKIVNTTDKYGMVQFYKYGKNANGKVEPLEGVKFALTLPGDETPKYTAVSEKDGRVRFQGVEPGLYEIRETSVGSNGEYVAAPGVIGTVTVTAGQIASPAFTSSESTGPLANPGYVNVSPKGRFQLKKTDEKGNTITGSPATFQLYGPFETEQNINGLTEIPQEWMQKLVKKADGSAYEMSTSNGMATSIALEEGYYVLKETKEPDGYAIIGNGMAQVKVAANTAATELKVQNTPKIKVRFLKEGKVGNVTVTDSAQLTGAEFEIWDSLTGGTCLYGGEEGNPKGTLGTKLVTAVDGTGNPYTEYAQLAPGTYYYIETKAPEGFQTPDGNTRTEFTVSRGEETKDITVVNTADYGRIKLVKKDSHSGQTLAGAKFQIFMDSACKQPVTDSKGNPVVLTSADNGIAYSPLLPKGTYWLKEIEAPKGHVMSKTVIQADVDENQETEIEVSNDPEVSLKIQKTDSVTGNVITEDTASFRLKAQDDGGVWQWVQADPAVTTDGVVVFTGLVPGKAYQIYEFKSPAGYVPADLANGTLVTVVTLPSIKEDGYGEGLIYSEVVKNVPLGTYKIYKTTDFDGNGANVPLGGAVFELYQCGDTPDAAADCVEKNLVSAQTTDEGGNAQWTGLLPGEYWLKEITAEGHQLMAENPRRVSVKPGQNTEGYPDLEQVDEIQNQAKDGKVAIAKADANEPGARLANVTFSIYKEEAGVTDYSGKEVIATLTTNQDGNAISGWLEPGAYVLVEQELPDELSSYERDTTPHAFTITAGETNRTYLENPIGNKKMGRLFVDKVAKFAVSGTDSVTYPLSGAKIRIFKCTGEGNKEADIQKNPVLDTFTMPGGSWESGLLPEGDYWIEEVAAPEGYHLNGTDQAMALDDLAVRMQNTYKISVVSGETAKTDANQITIANETKRGKLRVNKTSPAGTPLMGAEFTIYREVSEEEYQKAPADQKETATSQGKTVYLVEAKVSESSDASGSMMQTDANGTAATTTLKAGDTYWLKETKAPDGYYMGQEWYGPYVVEEGKETIVTAVNYPETPIEGQKTDASGKPLSGAYMAVYRTAADAGMVNLYLQQNQYETDAAKRAALKTVLEKKKNDPDYQFTGIYDANGFNHILQVAVSKADGSFAFRNLAPGTYYVAEVLPPDGYAYDFNTVNTLKVSVDDKGEIVYSPVTAVNHLMGYLTAEKVTMIGNKEYPVAGVKYNVYAAILENGQYVKTGTVLYTGYTDEQGIFKSVLLPAGHYIVEEADAEEYTEAAHPAPTIIEIGSADKGKTPNSGYYHAEVKEDETTDAGTFVNTAKVGKFTLQKQVVNNGYVNQEDVTATFKLEKAIDLEKNQWEVVNEEIPVTVKKNASASDIYLSKDLEAGTYRISETKMPGYTVNASVIQFEIRAGKVTGMDGNGNIIYGNAEDSPILFSNDHKGYLTIRKVGEYVNDKGELATKPLSNVEFKLYKRVSDDKKADCVKDNYIATKVTSGGNITNWELDAGNYWLVESSVGNNAPEYQAGGVESAMPITVEIGKTLELTGDQRIINESSYGRFKIKKVDANDGTGLSGAKFQIYTKKADDAKYSNTILTTSADGTVVTGLLPQGEYYLKETQSPSGYETPADVYYGPYAVTGQTLADYSNDAQGQIANKKYFTVQIEKVAAADYSPLAGAIFGLYDSEEAAEKGTLENTPSERKSTTTIQESGNSQKAVAVFEKLLLEDGDGKAVSSRTFYVKELKAPEVSGEAYLMNETIYPVTISYDKDQTVATLDSPIANDRKGKIGITKEGAWTDASGITGIERLEGAKFEIYAVEERGDSPSGESCATLVTGADGTALSDPLDAGWYVVKEAEAPAGYGLSDTLYWFEVKNNQIVTAYDTKDAQGGYTSSGAAIMNGAQSGRFLLKKYDGNASEPEGNLTALSGAVFKLYQKAADGTWKLYEGGSTQKDTFEVSQNGYTSWYLPYGDYMIREDLQQSKPYYTYTENNISHTIYCAPSQEEIEFTINEENAGKTLSLKAHNSPNGSIRFTKYGDTNHNGQIDAEDEKLEGATFRLYTDEACKAEALGGNSLRTTDAQGLCAWEELAPGTYYIKETQDGQGTVEAAGYQVMEEAVEVTVTAGLTINAIKQDPGLLVEEASMLDASAAGRIRVKKTDKDGNILAGAEFKIYKKSGDTWVDTQMTVTTTDSADGTLSGLLKADAKGTTYKVVEVKAPAGYTLDDRFYDLEQMVTVWPNHVPEADVNLVAFTNKKADEVQGFQAKIEKEISDDDEGYKKDAPVTSGQSLMEEGYDYPVNFKVDGYADGSNEVGASEFVVTDNDIKLYSKATKEMAGTDYKEMDVTTDPGSSVIKDYRMNSVTLGHSWNDSPYNDGIKEQTVGAKVYVQTTLAQKEQDEWPAEPYKVIEDLSPQDGVKVEFDEGEHVIGVKVEYTNVLAGFYSEGLVIHTTFLNRSWSSREINELRQISNQASIAWKDSQLDENGDPLETGAHMGSQNSQIVFAQIPSYIEKIPEVRITNTIQNQKASGFFSGEDIKYQVMAENVDVENQEEVFKEPVISVRMPADTTLVQSTSQLSSGFSVYYRNRDGQLITIPSTSFDIVASDVHPYVSIDADGNYVEDESRTTKQYTFVFKNFELGEGEQIFIDFTGTISYAQKTDLNALICPAYLSSNYTLPPTVENEKGLSYKPAAENSMVTEEPVIDAAVDKELEYLNQPAQATVSSATSVQLLKEISTDRSLWGSNVSVNAGDQVYYKLTLYNNSSNTLSEIRLTDILPFNGDRMTLTGTDRGTTTPASDASHDEMTLASVEAAGTSGGVNGEAVQAEPTVYYYAEPDAYANSWQGKAPGTDEADGALKMLYSAGTDGSAWSDGWSTVKPQERNISAVGVNVTFGEKGLQPGDSYEVVLVMNAPEYTVEQMSEYNGKIMANSAASAVILKGAAGDAIPSENRTEPNKVICTLNLPTGSIGDYVWFDANQDGIQNDTKDLEGNPFDPGLNGITVKLHQKITYRANGQIQSRDVVLKTTETRSKEGAGKGYYEFTDLPCNYLESGKTDQTNPDNYIGNEFYSYYVEFVLPDGSKYTPTAKYANGNERDEKDSNVNPDGTTDPVELWVSRDPDTGKLHGEKRTDIDAGLVNAYAIGDYVWKDTNSNGVQDDNEKGVEGVSVRLYKVEGKDGRVQDGDAPIASTVTDKEGHYQFDGLLQGYYVVEFDTSTLTHETNASGYTYQYDFTKVLKVDEDGKEADYSNENNSDSDAQEDAGENGRICRTRTIRLTKNDLTAAGIQDNMDDRWDAGLVEYSALGGFVFDDADYNDLHLDSLNIPLSGTKVALYKIDASGNREKEPIAETVVGADGRYYFDHLLIPDGTYQDYAVRFEYPEGYTGVQANQDPDGDDGAYDTKAANDSTIDSDVNEFSTVGGVTNRRIGYIRQIRLYPATISTTWDAGARKYSAIGDYVWIDANKNGLQDRTETPIPGVRVVLQFRDDQQSPWQYAGETTTDETGYYVFKDLESSEWISKDYRVVFALEPTRKVTTLNVSEGNKASTNDSDAIGKYEAGIIDGTLLNPQSTGGYVTANIKPGYGEEDMTWDCGVIPVLSALGDYVWYDDDYNGIQDDGEKGVPNVKVSLEYNESGRTGDNGSWSEIRTTYTDENGYYWFADLNPGYYRVRYYIPDGYRATKYNRGTGDNGNAVDSDASRRAEGNSYYSRHFYLNEDTQDPTWDAGIYKPQTRVVRKTTRRTTTRRRARRTRTGDVSNLALYALLLAASGGTAGTLYWKRKKKKGV